MFFRKAKDIIDDLFVRYQLPMVGEKNCMTLNEFIQLLKDCKLNDYILNNTRDIGFNLSMQN